MTQSHKERALRTVLVIGASAAAAAAIGIMGAFAFAIAATFVS
jgi:hypothetical protein